LRGNDLVGVNVVAHHINRAGKNRLHNGRNVPVLDIKLIREKPDFVRQRLATRGAGDEAHIDELLKLDEQRRKFWRRSKRSKPSATA
jgi:hypothetical protein